MECGEEDEDNCEGERGRPEEERGLLSRFIEFGSGR